MLDRDDDLDDDDLDDEDDDLSMPCPRCSATIYDDSERCPHCGDHLTRADLRGRPPLWVVMGVSIALVIVARWIIPFP